MNLVLICRSTCILRRDPPFSHPPSIFQSLSQTHQELKEMMNVYIAAFIFIIPTFLLLTRRTKSSKRLPPGSLGIPYIGQSISFLQALRKNTEEQWLQQRIRKYGPVSKLSLFGKPTVFISGQAANKFIFTSDDTTLSNQQVKSTRTIIGDHNIFELSSEDHKRVRGALLSFLKPDSLKKYIRIMDEEVREHLRTHCQGQQEVSVLPLMKTLTFNMISSLLFGIKKGIIRDKYKDCFQTMMKGVWAVPIDLPFTRYNRAMRESRRVQGMLKELIDEKRVKLEKEVDSQPQDLISHLLSIQKGSGKDGINEKEIAHNAVAVMIAGYDTTSVLLTFMMRLLANDPAVYAAVLQEHEEIEKNKLHGESLTWEDLNKMKYTWRVAMETLRVVPPVFGSFRQVLKDVEFDGYLIPKGWQIFWATLMTHMDDNIFPEPSKFDPSRFESQASTPRFCFVAFGGGSRICPGYEFARIETLVTIHYLITHFTWKLTADDLFTKDPLPTPTKGLPIQITQRKPL